MNGNMTKDLNKNISSIQYNLLNLPSKITYQDGRMINYIYSATGTKLSVTYTNGGTIKNNQYCGNMLYENGTLKQILIDGGYITFNGSTPQYHFYLKDHLGNNRVVVNASGTMEQVNHYYPYGGLMGESTNGDIQRYKYNDKELDRMNGLDWYDYSARYMDGIRFTTIDPLCEKDYATSPYVCCKDNPVRYVDPDGRSTKVIKLEDGTYQVVGGDINDKDRNIYVYTQDNNGDYTIRGESIGVTATMTSFYDSDKSEWSGTINPDDESGIQFLSEIMGENSPNIVEYMWKARDGKKYDFKLTNGTDSEINGIDPYRGMPISTSEDGTVTYASARDVGNMAAGYMAAKNGITWKAARKAFDIYQGSPEGRSTVSAELYGYTVLGYNTPAQIILRHLRKK